jgi:hypothetical protein
MTAPRQELKKKIMKCAINPTRQIMMLAGLQEFLDDAHGRDISLISYMRVFPEINNKERILTIWTSNVLPYLQRHPSVDKREQWARLRKFTAQELDATADKELNEVGQTGYFLIGLG